MKNIKRIWATALTLHHDLRFSVNWTERNGEFDVLGPELTKLNTVMGRGYLFKRSIYEQHI